MVRMTLGGQLLLDLGVEQPHLGLGQASQAVAELPSRAQQRRLVMAEALQSAALGCQAMDIRLIGDNGWVGG